MSFAAIIDAGRFTLNGRSICDAEPAKAFHELLGPPDRLEEAGQPAPFGSRNNRIQFYDDLGLYLNEHHDTFLVQAVTFILWHQEAAFATASDINGELRVGGVAITPGMTESDMQETNIPFVSQLRGTWQFKSNDLWIGFYSKAVRGPTGRRSKKRRIVSLSVCLKHDPWDARFRGPANDGRAIHFRKPGSQG